MDRKAFPYYLPNLPPKLHIKYFTYYSDQYVFQNHTLFLIDKLYLRSGSVLLTIFQIFDVSINDFISTFCTYKQFWMLQNSPNHMVAEWCDTAG